MSPFILRRESFTLPHLRRPNRYINTSIPLPISEVFGYFNAAGFCQFENVWALLGPPPMKICIAISYVPNIFSLYFLLQKPIRILVYLFAY